MNILSAVQNETVNSEVDKVLWKGVKVTDSQLEKLIFCYSREW